MAADQIDACEVEIDRPRTDETSCSPSTTSTSASPRVTAWSTPSAASATTLRPGEVLGIVGESGSGKSVTSLAVMGLLRQLGRRSPARCRFRGTELLGRKDKAMSAVRGKGIAMIFQDPMTSLDPVYKVGHQIAETLRVHDTKLSRKAAAARAVELLKIVGIPNAERAGRHLSRTSSPAACASASSSRSRWPTSRT